MKVQVGFSTCKKCLISKVIRYVTKSPCSHSFLLLKGGMYGMDMVLEADVGGFQLITFDVFRSGHDIVEIIDPKMDISWGVRGALRWLGERYDYTGLFGEVFVMMGRWLHQKWKNPLHEPHAMFCSAAVTATLQCAHYPGADKLPPRDTTPEELLEFMKQG